MQVSRYLSKKNPCAISIIVPKTPMFLIIASNYELHKGVQIFLARHTVHMLCVFRGNHQNFSIDENLATMGGSL